MSDILPLGTEGSIYIASDAIMGGGIGAVWGDIYFEAGVGLDVVVVFSESSDGDAVGQHDDAVVVSADADLIFSAYHAIGRNATEL